MQQLHIIRAENMQQLHVIRTENMQKSSKHSLKNTCQFICFMVVSYCIYIFINVFEVGGSHADLPKTTYTLKLKKSKERSEFSWQKKS